LLEHVVHNGLLWEEEVALLLLIQFIQIVLKLEEYRLLENEAETLT
jgi:hypothetical protein